MKHAKKRKLIQLEPNIRNTDGKSPLDMAKDFKKTENAKVLEDFALKPK